MRDRVIAPLVLMVAACGSSGPKVSLRYHPPAGAVYRFGSEQKTTVHADSGPLAAMGKRQMVLRFYFTQTVKGPAADGTEVDVLFETVSMEIPGIPSSMTGNALAGIQGAHATIVLDPRGAVIRSDFTGARGVSPDVGKRLAAGVNAVAFGFPEQPVGRGDSWTVKSELPLDDMPGMAASTSEVARTTLTVREIRIEGTDTSVVLDLKTEFPQEPIHLTTSDGESGTIKLEGGMTGRHVFSITRGALVDATIKGAVTMTLNGSGIRAGGMSMQTETENSVVLLPD